MNWIERGWYSASKLNFILLPLTVLFWLLSSVRKWLFKLGLKQTIQSPLPVIVVGNISVGGTGKTPFVIYLVELLRQQGFEPAIVSRGYGAEKSNDEPFPRLVTPELPVNLSGDEPKLLYLRTQCPVVIGSDRAQAVQFVKDNTRANIVISDDGLQHYKMARDIEIVLLDAKRMFGNGWLLPVGPLRELPSRLQTVDLTLINSGSETSEEQDQAKTEKEYQLAAEIAYNLLTPNLTLSTNTKVKLVSGIGNPQRFLSTALTMGYQVDDTLWFADHHQFKAQDFERFNLDDIILLTEKDAVKCRAFAQDNWYVLPISAVISKQVELKLLELINDLPKAH
ncbi:tetraacyldisaccharide 4'-kinase [Psychrosphaera aquimarina]|uniref:Tetraacyldisaccharide 4'-kinase n=1 Tax=Psychrosphaera aquimarina TaxID=2044854 RepID=A0ABU3R4U0_9GAMM|nr:tetraacyldisaccharide 4'-kinase [Psychrosphaera aquimarina]MDU0114701.1 tetraacyldisaccharide 4'-kinase [Psychrosphaera aquimarina]